MCHNSKEQTPFCVKTFYREKLNTNVQLLAESKGELTMKPRPGSLALLSVKKKHKQESVFDIFVKL